MAGAKSKQSPVELIEEWVNLGRSVLLRSLRYWPLGAIAVVLAVVAAWMTPRFLKPIYRSEAILQLHEGLQQQAIVENAGGGESSWKPKLYELLYSAPSVRELIEKEDLERDKVAQEGMPRAIDSVRKNMRFSAGGRTTFTVGYEHDNRELAQRVARRMGDLLVASVKNETLERSTNTRKFLEKEEAQLADQWRAAEADYARFLSAHPEFAPEDSPRAPVLKKLRQSAPTQASSAPAEASGGSSLAALQRQAARLRARLAQLREPAEAEAVAPPQPEEPELTPESKAAIQAATKVVERAQAEYNTLASQYTERHPDVIQAKSRLAALQTRLEEVKAAATIVAQPPPIAAAAAPPPDPAQEAELERQLRQVELALLKQPRPAPAAALAPAPSASATAKPAPEPTHDDNVQAIVNLETQWAELTKRRATLRGQHALIQGRLFNAIVLEKAQSVGSGAELVIAEPAYLPKVPSGRGPRRTAAAAAALALVLGFGVMLGLGFLDQRVLTAWDLARLDLAPVALLVPPPSEPAGRLSARRLWLLPWTRKGT